MSSEPTSSLTRDVDSFSALEDSLDLDPNSSLTSQDTLIERMSSIQDSDSSSLESANRSATDEYVRTETDFTTSPSKTTETDYSATTTISLLGNETGTPSSSLATERSFSIGTASSTTSNVRSSNHDSLQSNESSSASRSPSGQSYSTSFHSALNESSDKFDQVAESVNTASTSSATDGSSVRSKAVDQDQHVDSLHLFDAAQFVRLLLNQPLLSQLHGLIREVQEELIRWSSESVDTQDSPDVRYCLVVPNLLDLNIMDQWSLWNMFYLESRSSSGHFLLHPPSECCAKFKILTDAADAGQRIVMDDSDIVVDIESCFTVSTESVDCMVYVVNGEDALCVAFDLHSPDSEIISLLDIYSALPSSPSSILSMTEKSDDQSLKSTTFRSLLVDMLKQGHAASRAVRTEMRRLAESLQSSNLSLHVKVRRTQHSMHLIRLLLSTNQILWNHVVTDENLNPLMDVIEEYIFSKCNDAAIRESEDAICDQAFCSRTELLNSLADQELSMLIGMKEDSNPTTASPSPVLMMLSSSMSDWKGGLLEEAFEDRVPHRVSQLISRFVMSVSAQLSDHTSADHLVPLLIFALIRIHPRHLISTIRFIQRFRNVDQMTMGSHAFCLTAMISAVTAIEGIYVSRFPSDHLPLAQLDRDLLHDASNTSINPYVLALQRKERSLNRAARSSMADSIKNTLENFPKALSLAITEPFKAMMTRKDDPSPSVQQLRQRVLQARSISDLSEEERNLLFQDYRKFLGP